MTLALLTMAAACFMAGLGCLVQFVHYPLFALVGPERWTQYHADHSRRITFIVLPAMSLELGGAFLLAADLPAGASPAVAWAGFGAALSTWVVTGLGAVPAHDRLSRGYDAAVHRRLLRADALRTAGWAAHAVLATVLVGSIAG